jgi:uncharacterized protein (DUF1778 family)
MPTLANDARLNFRLPADIKTVIEQAAAATGQSVSDFAVSTLARVAREVVQEHQVTELTNRDRDRFLALLDDRHIKPTAALKRAAARYKRRHG